MRSLKFIAALLVPIAVSTVLFGDVAGDAKEAAEIKTRLERELRKIITNPADAKDITVKVVPASNPRQAVEGVFQRISVDASPAMIKGRSRFSSFSANASNVRVDVEKLRHNELEFLSAEGQTVNAVATPEDFSFILSKGKHTKNLNLKVLFQEDRIHVTGNWNLFLFRGPMDLVGRFRIQDQDQVHLVVDSLKINDRGAPRSVIRQFESKVNPLVETSEFLFKPKLRSIKVEGQRLILSS